MDLSLFDYTLPKSLIAQEPSTKRSDARLLVYDRKKESISHAQFKDIGDFLPQNVHFFRNHVSVLKAGFLEKEGLEVLLNVYYSILQRMRILGGA